LLLVLASVEPTFSGVAGQVYLAVALVLGAALFYLAVRFAAARNEQTARALFYGSITYLPLLWIVMIADKL
jgi:protoheme IX farnesyltransferase